MKIQVNNQEVEIPSQSTVRILWEQMQLPSMAVALAVNNELVPRAAWDGFVLNENDCVVIIKAACGG